MSVGRYSELERLFARHRLGPVESVDLLTGGRLNRAARINNQYVLRWREHQHATGSLRREEAVLQLLHGRVPTPEVVGSGLDETLGEYLLHRWIPGMNLLRAWLENPDVATREWWLLEWVNAVRRIHEERFRRPGDWSGGEFKESTSWRHFIESRIRKRVDVLMRVPSLDRSLLLTVERFSKRQAPVLEDTTFHLLHRDLHFGNALVNGPRLSGIIDFELACVGPLDYELDTIYRFLRQPAAFAEPALAEQATPVRFATVWVRLRRHYPELFSGYHLRERLGLYALDYELSCLTQFFGAGAPGLWGRELEAALDASYRRLGEILQGRYGPEDLR